MSRDKTLGSLFAGIGGFDLGFEQAGWRTVWQVEINPTNRLVLADRFPHARQFADVRECGRANLAPVACITAGFPCQDISVAGGRHRGKRPGLRGERSGLFHEVVRIAREVQPAWLVLENVPALLHSNDSQDFETVVRSLADSGYLGFWRVFDARYFGVPQARRRLFMVAGFGRYPCLDFLADAAPVEGLPITGFAGTLDEAQGRWAGHTLTARNTASRISLGCEVLIAEADRWSSMAERSRVSEVYGIRRGLDACNLAEAFAAGNAVVPAIARWIAEKLLASQ